jgi:hypothetical protein
LRSQEVVPLHYELVVDDDIGVGQLWKPGHDIARRQAAGHTGYIDRVAEISVTHRLGGQQGHRQHRF